MAWADLLPDEWAAPAITRAGAVRTQALVSRLSRLSHGALPAKASLVGVWRYAMRKDFPRKVSACDHRTAIAQTSLRSASILRTVRSRGRPHFALAARHNDARLVHRPVAGPANIRRYAPCMPTGAAPRQERRLVSPGGAPSPIPQRRSLQHTHPRRRIAARVPVMAGWLWSVVGEADYFWDMATRTRRHWVIVASREHARRGVTGGFVMANHGKRAPLARMSRGDGILIYSPTTAYPGGEPLRAVTVVGESTVDEPEPSDVIAGGFCRAAKLREIQPLPLEQIRPPSASPGCASASLSSTQRMPTPSLPSRRPSLADRASVRWTILHLDTPRSPGRDRHRETPGDGAVATRTASDSCSAS